MWIAVTVMVATVVIGVFSATLGIAYAFQGNLGGIAFELIPTALVVDLGLVGGLLAIRRPSNAIGWLLLVAGLGAAVTFGSGDYEALGHLVGATLPFVVPIDWVAKWVSTLMIGLLLIFLPLLFPTGHLTGPRWRAFAGFAIVAILAATLAGAAAPGPMPGFDGVSNPVQLPEPVSSWIQAIGALSNLAAPPAFLVALASVVVRFRASRGVERQQLKWFLFVAFFTAIAFGVSIVFTGPVSDTAWLVGLIALACLPIAIGIAILRYRLYDIDRIISRTISYAIVTAVLAAVYIAGFLGLQALLAPFTSSEGPVAVATSTLAVFALFQPVRRRIQSVVDRRFNRARYDAEREVERFAAHVRDEVEVERVTDALAATLQRTMQPASAALWLRAGGKG